MPSSEQIPVAMREGSKETGALRSFHLWLVVPTSLALNFFMVYPDEL